MKINDFMLNLMNDLKDKKKLKESSINAYIRILYNLNNKTMFNNFAFLKKYNIIKQHLKAYSINTRKSYLSAIVTVLDLIKHKATYKKPFQYWKDLLDETSSDFEENKKDNVKTEKQAKNWIEWDEILKLQEEYKKDVSNFKSKLKDNEYAKLLNYFILMLYTSIPPRRNMDYQKMYIVKKYDPKIFNDDNNYYCMDSNKFIFNVYKTAKKYGQQIIDINDNKMMIDCMKLFLKYHPLLPKKLGKSTIVRLLTYYDGSPLNQTNSITRILNKIFKKKVGASMLRHIYLSSKYSDELEEMKKDAKEMGHSLEMQKEYIKNDEI
jgi:hypothetical protein